MKVDLLAVGGGQDRRKPSLDAFFSHKAVPPLGAAACRRRASRPYAIMPLGCNYVGTSPAWIPRPFQS
jgi:hypothetical protein